MGVEEGGRGEEGVYAIATDANKCYRVWPSNLLLEGEEKEEKRRRTRSSSRIPCDSRHCGCCAKVRRRRGRGGREGGEGENRRTLHFLRNRKGI